jgi:DNA polymerase III delta prime subunit
MQEEAVSAISRAIRRARVGLKNPNRPIASFIFAGPTGVGKSELAKTLANYYFGSEEAMVRFLEQLFATATSWECMHGCGVHCVSCAMSCQSMDTTACVSIVQPSCLRSGLCCSCLARAAIYVYPVHTRGCSTLAVHHQQVILHQVCCALLPHLPSTN